MAGHCRWARLLLLASAVGAPALWAQRARQAPLDSTTLERRMHAFASARQFRDLDALLDLMPPTQLDSLQSFVTDAYSRFRRTHPSDLPFPSILASVREITGDSVYDDIDRGLADALWLMQEHDPPRRAAASLASHRYLGSRLQVVDSMSHRLARFTDSSAVYYLTEWLTDSLAGSRSVARHVILWLRRGGRWYVSDVR